MRGRPQHWFLKPEPVSIALTLARTIRWHLGVSCDWLAGFATKYNLWETPTWKVVADVVKPKTKLL